MIELYAAELSEGLLRVALYNPDETMEAGKTADWLLDTAVADGKAIITIPEPPVPEAPFQVPPPPLPVLAPALPPAPLLNAPAPPALIPPVPPNPALYAA